MTGSHSVVEQTIQNGVGWVRLNRPERRNAFDTAMRTEFAEIMADLDGDDAVHIIAIIGAGTAFCAGADLKEDATTKDRDSLAAPRMRISAPVESSRKPVLACINGAAVGGGLELALAADMRIASRGARMGLAEVRVGSIPGGGGVQRLSRAVPEAVANRMLFSGDLIDADEAFRVGLVSDLYDDGEFESRAQPLAETLAANAPLALRMIKVAARQGSGAPVEVAALIDDLCWRVISTTHDWQEGRAAFREGRPPEYRGY